MKEKEENSTLAIILVAIFLTALTIYITYVPKPDVKKINDIENKVELINY